jgi:adenylyltransferase/sulfurtransferase
MEFGEQQIQRYARHIILGEIGVEGQARLLQSSVLVVGAGGLGAPLLQYLAAAGIGRLGVVDDDEVDLSNLQRQVIHRTRDIGIAKVASAHRAVGEINPDVRLEPHAMRLDADNVAALIARYDIVADGSDNFATRYVLNDACYFARKPLVSAAILRFEGQLTTHKAYLGAGHPCLRCLFASPPPPDQVPSCAAAGVLGALAGTMGSLQATEVIKELLDIGQGLSGRLLLYDALAAELRALVLAKAPDCPLCGTHPSILPGSAS